MYSVATEVDDMNINGPQNIAQWKSKAEVAESVVATHEHTIQSLQDEQTDLQTKLRAAERLNENAGIQFKRLAKHTN